MNGQSREEILTFLIRPSFKIFKYIFDISVIFLFQALKLCTSENGHAKIQHRG